MLLEQARLDKELIDVYKLSKKYGIKTLSTEVCKRLHLNLQDIWVEGSKENGGSKKKYKAENVISAVTKIAEIYESYINSTSREPHKIVVTPTGSVVILDEKKYMPARVSIVLLPEPLDALSSSSFHTPI